MSVSGLGFGVLLFALSLSFFLSVLLVFRYQYSRSGLGFGSSQFYWTNLSVHSPLSLALPSWQVSVNKGIVCFGGFKLLPSVVGLLVLTFF